MMTTAMAARTRSRRKMVIVMETVAGVVGKTVRTGVIGRGGAGASASRLVEARETVASNGNPAGMQGEGEMIGNLGAREPGVETTEGPDGKEAEAVKAGSPLQREEDEMIGNPVEREEVEMIGNLGEREEVGMTGSPRERAGGEMIGIRGGTAAGVETIETRDEGEAAAGAAGPWARQRRSVTETADEGVNRSAKRARFPSRKLNRK